jgi:PAS domain S-box-containing protein
MKDKELPSFDYFRDEDDSATFIDRGLHHTETIDLQGLMDELDSPLYDGKSSYVKDTPFGKLMEALPIPALLIDSTRDVVFANQACEKISPDYKGIEGGPFSSLFPDSKHAAKAEALVEKVFSTRKTQVIEGVLDIEDKKIWARSNLRSLRVDGVGSILVMIEDLTLEKTQLALQKRIRKELEVRVEKRTADLQDINERLQKEIADRSYAELELKKHRQQLEEVVVSRTTELNSTINRLKQQVRERKKAENSHRASEKRFNVAFHANPSAVSIATLDEGRYLEVNDSFCKLTEYERDEAVGRTATELNLWSKPEHRDHIVGALSNQRVVRDFETIFLTKSGKRIAGSVSAEVIDLDGRPYVLSTILDITGRKRSEVDRTRMTIAFEHAAESILIANVAGVIKYANPAFEAISGYTREESIGKNISFLRSQENEKSKLEESVVKLKEGEPWKGRLTNKKKDGSRYEVETSISPVKSKSGHLINFVVVERDVTEEARLEKQLRQSQKMEAMGRLAGGIAHDFNNILMAIIGYTELAVGQLPEETSAKKDLHEVLGAGRRARDLVNQILAFSRQDEQERRPVRVQLVLEEAFKLLRASMPSTIDIRRNIGEETRPVLSDSTQIHQVIMNLCTNAYHAIGDKHGILEVTLDEDEIDGETAGLTSPDMKPGPYVKLTIADTGTGMTGDVLERIFDPYFTTKELGEGTGMGLSVVHGVVRSHGGGITVHSEPGQGTTVNVFLPCCDEQAMDEPTEVRPMERGTERIMFIDDEETIAELGRRILESLDYQVTVLTDPVAAMDTFRRQPQDFDLVVTDFTMPKMTGLELAEDMMKIRPDIPIILCTGFSENLSRKKVLKMGVAEYLVKPITPSVLSNVIRSILTARSRS